MLFGHLAGGNGKIACRAGFAHQKVIEGFAQLPCFKVVPNMEQLSLYIIKHRQIRMLHQRSDAPAKTVQPEVLPHIFRKSGLKRHKAAGKIA